MAVIDLNELEEINDPMGHCAGDSLICRTAKHIAGEFTGSCYRIDGDEFVVIDSELEKEAFRAAVGAAKKNMEQDGISVSTDISWRDGRCSVEEQFDEADRQMDQEKLRFTAPAAGTGEKAGEPEARDESGQGGRTGWINNSLWPPAG